MQTAAIARSGIPFVQRARNRLDHSKKDGVVEGFCDVCHTYKLIVVMCTQCSLVMCLKYNNKLVSKYNRRGNMEKVWRNEEKDRYVIKESME